MVVSPKRILWPTDFSAFSLQGARYARGFREVFGSELHIIHVVAPPLSPDVAVMLPAELPVRMAEKEILDACRQGLEKLVNEQFEGDTTIKTDTFFGNPWSSICEYANNTGVDLIIVTTHGRTGLKRALIGSTAEQIVRHAPCPVLTVKIEEKEFVIE